MISNTNDWPKKLIEINKQDYYKNLLIFLDQEKKLSKTIYPPKDLWFKAFEYSSFANTKVVIIGQDPYHKKAQAEGLSFSVPKGIKIPPSLKNIFQEIADDLNVNMSNNGNLKPWADQGVLLLNSVLTVEKDKPSSHSQKGWEMFTNYVIRFISINKKNIVFMLWGSYAKDKAKLIDVNKHLILQAPHPSPLSAYRGFFGCRHFSKANEYLKNSKQKQIKWHL